MRKPIRIGLVMGRVREGRLCDTVSAWVMRTLQGNGDLSLRVIDPLRLGSADAEHRLGQQLDAVDGFIVVTPEYNHSFPGPLKQLIDTFFHEWQAKPVAFVSYGGLSGGIRAVEQLRLVFAELHAVTLRDAVALPQVWDRFDAFGELNDAGRTTATLERMASRLAWWARAMQRARAEEPYDQAV
ncbi:NADPH-dependent FMN reductase [Marinobacter bohaiensis]|uniref:NADPH-dependent FMN reductase n=1 Tax=Marinobacter bohaiensis TaxID=2201898 RepID=UPI000DACF122|nr:NAD(P)H-dependent oxidoreductase [Marinobacter bohaiensis]